MNLSKRLKELLTANETLVLPDAYDPISDLKECGVARVSLPTVAICATVKALLQTMEALKSGAFTNLVQEGRLCGGPDIGRTVGAQPDGAPVISQDQETAKTNPKESGHHEHTRQFS